MAQPVTPKCLKGCILAPLITLVVIIAIVGIAVGVVLNMTPDQLGFADVELFDGNSLRDMGMADVKIKEVFSLVKSIMNPDESKIVTNGYDEEKEKSTASSNMENSSVTKDENGNYDYTALLSEPAVYDAEYLIEYDDTTLAYIFNSMIDSGTAAVSEEESVKFLKDINASIDEVSINAVGTGYELRIVSSINTGSIVDDIKKALPAGMGGLIKIPSKIYLVSYSVLSADAEGMLVTTSKEIKINDTDNAIASAIFKVLSGKVDQATEGEVEADDNATVNAEIGKAFASIVKNLGLVGTAPVDSNGVVNGAKTLGVSGLADGKLSVITYDTAPVAEGGEG